MNRILKMTAFVIGCELVGLAATPITVGAIPAWYQDLQKPFFAPPNSIFGPVWTILYGMMGVAAFLVYERRGKKKQVKTALGFFCAQLVLNFLWSILFFGLRSPLLGLVDILALLILIVVTASRFYPLSPAASLLLVPYALWVTFATMLNAAIFVLNR